jgi:NAD(P) transhydrogenase subunit beta
MLAAAAASDGDVANLIERAGPNVLVNVGYLVASVLFILGIKGMTHPRTAVRGNLLGAVGMLIAVVVTLAITHVAPWVYVVGMVLGTAIGAWMSVKVQMTQMPQLVALFNGFGGIASVLVAGAEVLHPIPFGTDPIVAQFSAGLTGLIGAVTFTGSLIAAAKLQELKAFDKPLSVPGQQIFNAALLALCVWLSWTMTDGSGWEYFVITLLAFVLGVMLTLPIGGADMPVVIALLNSYSGLAGAAAGFVISNNVLIIAGALVGASGIILTQIMCKAMNRSLVNVLFGKMEAGAGARSSDDVYAGKVKSTSPEEVAMLLDGAQRVVVVPGYGLAVAQAQHVVRELADLLEDRGTTVEYAIHPVAGRMPGHMNVLLAEADVPYSDLVEMDEINPDMPQCDVALVIGANDVVNPAARHDKSTPIFGMPIINADKAKTVLAIKRSKNPGFAGIDNELYFADRTFMLFGDAKAVVGELVKQLSGGSSH